MTKPSLLTYDLTTPSHGTVAAIASQLEKEFAGTPITTYSALKFHEELIRRIANEIRISLNEKVPE